MRIPHQVLDVAPGSCLALVGRVRRAADQARVNLEGGVFALMSGVACEAAVLVADAMFERAMLRCGGGMRANGMRTLVWEHVLVVTNWRHAVRCVRAWGTQATHRVCHGPEWGGNFCSRVRGGAHRRLRQRAVAHRAPRDSARRRRMRQRR